MNTLLDFPLDILIVIFELLFVQDLSALSQTSRSFLTLVNEFGWAAYLRKNPRPSLSLCKSRNSSSAKRNVMYDVLTDKSWSQFDFIARPLAPPWPGKEQPILAMNSSRLVIAAGNTLYSYVFGVSTSNEAPSIAPEGSCPLNNRGYITALTCIPDGGLDQTFCVGLHDGTSEHIVISPRKQHGVPTLSVHGLPDQPPFVATNDPIESLTSSGTSLLSLSASGRAILTDTQTSRSPSTIELGTRSWVSHLNTQSSSPFAVFGSSSKTRPLTVHAITHDHLSPLPTASLEQAEPARRGSAVYGICKGPPSLWGSSPEIIVSGWYDGTISIHDLRSPSRGCASDNSSPAPAPLRPVLTLMNQWSIEPIYSVASGGGTGCYIAAGWGRHSLVSLWDVRFPSQGLSIHAPSNDPSPVYSLILESSRLFGVTQSRPFVFDFGPGVTENTYPSLPASPRSRSKRDDIDGLGYYVTSYLHAAPSRLTVVS
ncbi:F-box domain-containing protein [Favolaschia claudopus]|uniref:F-box domain-containing protein n=1 Tax=Favolaschia claudopus TaxID=2862362 RepID=A0AAW0DCY2_9AGAR